MQMLSGKCNLCAKVSHVSSLSLSVQVVGLYARHDRRNRNLLIAGLIHNAATRQYVGVLVRHVKRTNVVETAMV